MPKGRMGPPLRSLAADAYDCIMVRVLGPTGYKVVARSRPQASSPLTFIPIAPSVPSRSALSRCGLATAVHAARLARRPTLTAPARVDVERGGSGRRNGLSNRTKKPTKEKRCAARPEGAGGAGMAGFRDRGAQGRPGRVPLALHRFHRRLHAPLPHDEP